MPDKVPFKRGDDGSIQVSKDYIEANRDQLTSLANSYGMKSPEEFLSRVVHTPKYFGKSSASASGSWTDEDKAKAEGIAGKFGLSPNEFQAIIQRETAGTMAPDVKNSIGATGLIQFVPTTAASYLLKEQRAAAVANAQTPEELKAAKAQNPLFEELSPSGQKKAKEWGQKTMAVLPISRQLDLADMYLTDRAGDAKGLDNVYTSIFAGNPSQTKFASGSDAYSANSSLDKDGKGYISREDWVKPVRDAAAKLDSLVPAKRKVIPAEQRDTSDEEANQIKDRAAKLLKLSQPNTSMTDIKSVIANTPVEFMNVGSPQNDAALKKGAIGNYWTKSKTIDISKSAPKSIAPALLAHEYGHAQGLDHPEDDVQGASIMGSKFPQPAGAHDYTVGTPFNEVQVGKIQEAKDKLRPDPQPTFLDGLPSWLSTPLKAIGVAQPQPVAQAQWVNDQDVVDAQEGPTWGSAVKIAAKEGGKTLDNEQAAREAQVPFYSWFAGPAMPSKSFDYNTMNNGNPDPLIATSQWGQVDEE